MFRRLFRKAEKEPVRATLNTLRRKRTPDAFTRQLLVYLEWAASHKLEGQSILDSSLDLAATLTHDPFYVWDREQKLKRWQVAREAALSSRRHPRELHMKLDPLYFFLILGKRKTFEGRAYHPSSQYCYQDIRRGDSIRFSIDSRAVGWEEECGRLGLHPRSVMRVTVENVLFSPWVHWMYEFHNCEGEQFQPSIWGVSELLQTRRAAVYYTFPDYRRRIIDHGFIGLEIKNPQPVM